MEVIFRCPPWLEGKLPRPYPAVEALPEWFKSMPLKAYSATLGNEEWTVKRCPPFIDAMTYGFMMPLAADLAYKDGAFSWDWEIGGTPLSEHTRSPIDFHDSIQATGSPFFEEDCFLVKFNSFWTIELPPGYSLLVTHPINRADLPFLTLTGLVDADRYKDNFVNFPGAWIKKDFEGVVPKGTPVAQCIPVARESWALRCEPLSESALARLAELRMTIQSEQGVYRKNFRTAKR
ncbi:MAG: hypothetical protein ACHQF3_05220 [Alphaproteobacteria bacterium]